MSGKQGINNKIKTKNDGKKVAETFLQVDNKHKR